MPIKEEAKTETELSKQNRVSIVNLPMEKVVSLAQAFYESGVFSDTKSESQAIVKIIAGEELGLAPIYSMQNFYLIETTNYQTQKSTVKLAQSASSMAYLLIRDGDFRYKVTEETNERCSVVFEELFKNKWQEVYTSTWTIADAKQAGLMYRADGKPKAGSSWFKYPKDMLFARAIARGCRRLAPHKLGGAKYTPEEVSSGTIEQLDAISPQSLLESAPAPKPEEIKVKRERGKGKTTSGVVKAAVDSGAEVVSKEEETANQAFDAMSKGETKEVDTETGEIAEDKETSLAEETPATEGEITNKEEHYHEIKPKKKTVAPPSDTIPDPPQNPASVNTYMKMLNVAYADMTLQPKDAYSILGCSNTQELEKKYTPKKAYLVLWKHYCETQKEGK